MDTGERSERRIGRPPYWLLSRSAETATGGRRGGYHDVLTLESGAGRTLPLFSSEERAASFLGRLAPEDRQAGWGATEAGAGEILTLLSASGSDVGPCAGVGDVAFDPPEGLTEPLDSETPTVGRRVFMDRLLGRGGRWSES